jgi:hypothetical protein
MRNPRASTGQNSELLFMHIMFPKQVSMSVNEYITKFTQLSHYAPHEVNTDEKKRECFFNGLNDGLAYGL